MKLLLYSHFFAPSIGGVETFAMSLAQGLTENRSAEQSQSVEVTLITQTPSGTFDDASLPFPVIRQPSMPLLRRSIREADVIHIDGPALAPLFFAWLARKPVAVEHHVYQAICLNGLLIHQPDRTVCPGYFQAKKYSECLNCQSTEMSGPQALLELVKGLIRNQLVRRVAKNIAITDHVQQRVALPNSVRIYHGITDPSQAASALADSQTTGKICFAFVGRFVAEKGIAVLLEAAQQLAKDNLSFELRLIGDGPLRPGLEEFVRSANLQQRVTITGYLAGASLHAALQDVSVVVMPSVWEETAGLSAMEQMMRGRLVIASNIGGLGEVVGDAGLLCSPGDPTGLANCMRSVLTNPSQIDTIGKKARTRALALFRQERMLADHLHLYRELTKQIRVPTL